MSFLVSFIRLNWKPLLVVVIAGAIWFAIHRWGEARYAAGRADERAPWLIAQASAEKAAREAIQAHIDTANATDKRNAETIAGLDRTLADASRDHDQLSGLLAAARQRAAASHPVSAAANQPAASEPSTAQSDGRLDGLLASAITECNGNRAGQTALIAEIQPQL